MLQTERQRAPSPGGTLAGQAPPRGCRQKQFGRAVGGWESLGSLPDIQAREGRNSLVVHPTNQRLCLRRGATLTPFPSAADSPPLARQRTCGRHTCEPRARTSRQKHVRPHPHGAALGPRVQAGKLDRG